MKNWILIAAMAATALTGASAWGAQPQGDVPPPPAGAPMPPPPGGPLARADADDDGVVTRAEVTADADRRFAAMDVDRDGKIEEGERRAFRQQRRAMRPAPIPRAGGDMPPPGVNGDAPPPPPPGADRPDRRRHDGRPPRPRDETQDQFRDHALRMFDRIDTNHDGRVDAQERAAAAMLARARRIGDNGDRRGPPPPPPGGAMPDVVPPVAKPIG